jgi:hypothetical protein
MAVTRKNSLIDRKRPSGSGENRVEMRENRAILMLFSARPLLVASCGQTNVIFKI